MQNVKTSTVSQRHLQNNFKRGVKNGIKPTKGDEEFTSTNISDKKSFSWWKKIHDWSRKLVNYISSFTHQSLALRRIWFSRSKRCSAVFDEALGLHLIT